MRRSIGSILFVLGCLGWQPNVMAVDAGDPRGDRSTSWKRGERGPVAGKPRTDPASATDGPSIRGTVSVSPEVTARVSEDAVLFIIARRPGQRMPFAVQRIASPHFPLEFSLGPEHRMVHSLSFSGRLEISARLDTDGNALSRQVGDLEGHLTQPVAPGVTDLVLVLDRVVDD